MIVQKTEGIVLCKLCNHLRITRKIQDIILLQHKVRRGKLLVDSAHKPVLTCTASQLKDIDSVLTIDIQIHHSLSDSLRIVALDVHAEKVVRHSILLHKLLK